MPPSWAGSRSTTSRRALLAGVAAAPAALASSAASGQERPVRLRDLAARRGIAFGSSAATWQLDAGYRRLLAREAGVLLTEDDLLWHRLKRTPEAPLDFDRGDRIVALAERHGQLTIGAHLVWDEGFGPGWTDADLWGLGRHEARRLLYGVVRAEVEHYRGRMSAWVVANEVTSARDADRHGLRRDDPWWHTIGPGYVAHSFELARAHDPRALRILNEYGFETDTRHERAGARRRAFLTAVDHLLSEGTPLQAVGIQGHLSADGFGRRFDERAYRRFLGDLADRGLRILITELDVLDTGLPPDPRPRDRAVADVYRRYLDVALDEPAVKAVLSFGLTDRYTWLEEDRPRQDGRRRRPLPFDRQLRPKPAYDAMARALRHAPVRRPLWRRGQGY